jgi:hypothetical protein
MAPEADMAHDIPQTYATHRRLDPLYHMVGFPLLLLALVLSVVHLFRQPGLAPAWELVASLVLFITFFRARTYALRNQDRLIRLEETLRMERLLPGVLRARIQELKPAQFVALRFAPDGELVGLVEQALDEGLDQDAIKRRIQGWRSDTFRV